MARCDEIRRQRRGKKSGVERNAGAERKAARKEKRRGKKSSAERKAGAERNAGAERKVAWKETPAQKEKRRRKKSGAEYDERQRPHIFLRYKRTNVRNK